METTRSRILSFKRANPEASTRDIADHVNISNVRVWQVLVEAGIITPGERRPAEPKPRFIEATKPRPEIRPHMMPGLSLSQLMGGRAPRAKLSPA